MTKPAAIVCLVLALGIVPQVSAERRSRECREGTGDFGIGQYVCDGTCTISTALGDGRIVHRFSVEPRITSIDPKGPSAKILRENDVLVAIDGSLITTLEGGYKLANAKIGKAVRLRIRRGATELEVQVVPGKGCNLPGLSVTQ